MPVKAVVLARAESRALPTPLLSVANRPLLGHALDWLDEGGIRQAAIVIADGLADEARRAIAERPPALEMRWLEHRRGESVAEFMGKLSGFVDGEPFVLHLADSLSKEPLRETVGEGLPERLEALLVVNGRGAAAMSGVVDLRARRGRVPGRHSLERLDSRLGGVAVLGPAMAQAAAAAAAAIGQELEAVAQYVHEFGGRVRLREASTWWRFRPSMEAVLEGNRFALEGLRADFDRAGVTASDIQGGVVAHPTARIEASIVRGPVIVGAGARVRDSYVGPYTALGRDVLVEGSEIEHSIILAGASISQLGGRLEASVVGPRARVFRDFRLPKALRLNVGEGAQVTLA
jgi:glucose-1-phosphate thymidylyltransferase